MPTKPTAVVHISTSSGAGALSKAQKEFNRLSKRVEKLEKELANFRKAAEEVRRQVQHEYRPLQARHDAARAALVPLLDAACRTPKALSTTERSTARHLLADAFNDLPEKGYPDLQPILEQYAPGAEAQAAATAADAASDRLAADLMRQMFEMQYGVRFDPEVDISSPEKFHAYVAHLLAEQASERQATQAAAEARRATRPKTKKQLEAEARKAAEEKATTQSVRTVYRDLVKVLHPDREPDPAEKARKTALLQRVTAAYEANELLTLLRLQLELDRLEPAHLERLADAQLAPYNRLLREQVRELEDTLADEQMTEADYSDFPYPNPSAHDLCTFFQEKKNSLLQRVTQLERDVRAIGTEPAALKRFLKEVKRWS